MLKEIPIVWISLEKEFCKREQRTLKVIKDTYSMMEDFCREGYYTVVLSSPERSSFRRTVFWNERNKIEREDVLEILGLYSCNLLIVLSDQKPCVDIDCLINITVINVMCYHKDDNKSELILHSITDFNSQTFINIKRFILNVLQE